MMDELAITKLLQDWGLWRDTGRWDKLRSAYARDAQMKTTWFDGPAQQFVDASTRMSGKPQLVQHFMGPSTVEVCGARAVAETRVMLLLRDVLGDVAVDVTCLGRFVDRLVKQEGRWLILSRVPVYEKDSIAPVLPGRVPELDAGLLGEFPAGYRHLAYLQSLGGAQIVTDIPAHNSDAQQQLYAQASQWLHEHDKESSR